MRLSGRSKAIVVLAAAAVWLTPATALASLWLVLDRTSGPGGAVVHGATLGSGAVTLAPSRPLPLFLVAERVVSEIKDPSDERLIPLGELVVDADGDGTTTFTIPDVVPGRYDVLVHCEPCAPASGGATMLFVADLTVSSLPPATDTVVASTSGEWPLFALVFAVATWVVLRRVQDWRV